MDGGGDSASHPGLAGETMMVRIGALFYMVETRDAVEKAPEVNQGPCSYSNDFSLIRAEIFGGQ